MRILLVEDDELIASAVREGLKSKAYAVDVMHDGKEARYAPVDVVYDCILLDLGLPLIDGITLLKIWRESKVSTPVIIITARDGLDDRVSGLDIGADDYVVKPFDLKELLARIRAVTRRTAADNNRSSILSNGVISLDTVSHEVHVLDDQGNSHPVSLTAREFALLETLMHRPGAVMSRETIEDKIYSFGDEVESNAVEFLIHNLRKKIGAQNIKNVRGVGWKVAKAE